MRGARVPLPPPIHLNAVFVNFFIKFLLEKKSRAKLQFCDWLFKLLRNEMRRSSRYASFQRKLVMIKVPRHLCAAFFMTP